MGRAYVGLALIVVAIVLGVAFFTGNLGPYIDAARVRILRPDQKTAAPFPGRKPATVAGPGGRSHLS